MGIIRCRYRWRQFKYDDDDDEFKPKTEDTIIVIVLLYYTIEAAHRYEEQTEKLKYKT